MFSSTNQSIYSKILNRSVNTEQRIINTFPKPYNKEVTPYWKCDFNEEIKSAISFKEVEEYLGVCKAIFIGDVSVGKTSLVNKFCYETYELNYNATIGVDFEVETFEVLSIPFTLQIFDTAGQERFKCIAHSYYRNAQVIVLVFDMTNIQSLNERFLNEALLVNNRSDFYLFLVGTKSDLLSDNEFQKIEKIAILEANKLNAELWIVSAYSGDNINSMFRRIVALSFNRAVERFLDPQISRVASRIKLSSKETKDRKRGNCTSCN